MDFQVPAANLWHHVYNHTSICTWPTHYVDLRYFEKATEPLCLISKGLRLSLQIWRTIQSQSTVEGKISFQGLLSCLERLSLLFFRLSFHEFIFRTLEYCPSVIVGFLFQSVRIMVQFSSLYCLISWMQRVSCNKILLPWLIIAGMWFTQIAAYQFFPIKLQGFVT